MEKDADILSKYRLVTNKLKKRFLKKPNVAEGSEQFAALAKNLRRQECPQYSGFCCLAQARCEHTLANAAGEAQALTEAARSFLEAEMANRDLKCPSFEEHLSAAINCYSHAIRVHIENKQPALGAALCMELGDVLMSLNKASESMGHYQRAAELQSQGSGFTVLNPLDCLEALGNVASCKISTKDYDGALAVLTEMSYLAQERGGSAFSEKPIGAYSDILARCELTRVLLLMLLQPTPQRIRPEHAQTLEKYAWGSTEDSYVINFLDEDLFLLLQSVVMACQSRDLDSLRSLQVELWPMLSSEQNQLLHLIIEELNQLNFSL
ncbi:40-kDa huntingtin-associated protein isoform X1 [Octopus sinensis]|uniref:40-kDa huntingtin-associated protein isoform X1 n=1 Tax=Octopus sinensis TaxID=2607531 RepID=A0A6P7U0X6_9MOLL|nr:40-kDa huntingtin-associated protein isoform X1 [Octopus sinensis]XP_029655192.1 40-kDa huntingtin-associated protein isoform X1 [Octopus sinensis]